MTSVNGGRYYQSGTDNIKLYQSRPDWNRILLSVHLAFTHQTSAVGLQRSCTLMAIWDALWTFRPWLFCP